MSHARAAEHLRETLSLYDTLSRTAPHFVPADQRVARVYICGPTVYSSPHVGNMRTYIFGDILRRVLRFAGYGIHSVMNVTDVGHLTSDADTGDDKMAKAARAERASSWEIARKYTELFFSDAERLNILPTEEVLFATEHIDQQIDLIRRLEGKGVLYTTSDGVYFDTSLVPDYGKLTPNDTRENLLSGARVSMKEKRHATDFAVWKFSPKDGVTRDMEWPSPWGVGFPGWHIECSAMAMESLGDTLDLHLGGVDHIPVHHTNEIAQSETATGVPFSRWWMHGAFLTLEGERRMGKSQGNKITLDDLAGEGFDALDFRYLVLLSHYRSPLSFSLPALEKARNALKRLRTLVSGWQRSLGDGAVLPNCDQTSQLASFVDAIADDLNIPRALAVLWSVVRDAQLDDAMKLSLVLAFDEVFGLELTAAHSIAERIPPEILQLAEDRWRLRQEKRYEESDSVRAQLLAFGYIVNDGPEGYEVVSISG